MSTPTIVFDLDGTLIDTAPDLVEALNVILATITSARPLPGAGRKNARGFWTLWPISPRIPISWVASQGPAAQAMDGNSGTCRFNN